MIDFNKLNLQEIQELQNIVSKNSEKSELEKYYLYTNDTLEKSKIYIWCFRFLYSVRNLTKDGNLKGVLNEELRHNEGSYINICNILHKVEKSYFNKHRNLEKLRLILLEDDNIDDMIDAFVILLEKSSVLSMSRLKGIILEGQSGKDFKRLFDNAKDGTSSDDVATSVDFDVEIDPPEPEDNSDGFNIETKERFSEIPIHNTTEIPEEVRESEQFDVSNYIGEGVMKEDYENEEVINTKILNDDIHDTIQKHEKSDEAKAEDFEDKE